MALPRNVVREDHRLEKEAERTSSALVELRWHWTLDESNPKRVSVREYARTVGRGETTIRNSVNARAVYTAHPGISMADARTRARLKDDRLAAVAAVAKARGVTLETAEHKRRNEARRVQQIAAERAEEKGSTIEEEAPKVAEWIVKAEKADANTKAARNEKVDFRLIEAEAKGHRMIRLGVEILGIIRAADWDDESVEALEELIDQMRALVGLMDVALVGAADVDWDKELAKLNEATT